VQGYESLVLTAGGGGGGGPMGGSSGSNQGSLKILLPEPSRQLDSPKTIQTRLSAYLAGIPGADVSFTSGRRFSSGSAVDIEIRSKDQAASLAAARQIENLVAAKFPAARNLGISLESGAPELRFRIDRDRATLHGFTVAAVAAELRSSVYGSTATSIDMEGESLDVIVRLREEDRKSLEDLESIFLIDAQGQSIPLSDFVTVIAGSAPETIARENKERIIHVEGDTDGSIPTTEVSSLLRQILDEGYVEREGVTVSLGGERMDIERISGVFLLIIGLAVFLVYGVMASQFESFIDPLVIFFSIPLMLIGVVWIYRLTNDTFSLFSAVGLVALAGVVVNNGIVLVDYTNTLRARGLALFEACTEAGRHRLRPILMSTLTTVLGIAPLALFPGAGSENIQPIAKTMLGGLTVQSVITLFLTPVLYSIFNGRSERLNRKKLRQVAGMAGEARGDAVMEPAMIPAGRIEEVINDKN
jgi:HAE1 family hydrophobic/amphiphilic exporter-1